MILDKKYNWIFEGNWKIRAWLICTIICMGTTFPMFLLKDFDRMSTNDLSGETKIDRIYVLKRQISNPLDSNTVKLFLPQTHNAKIAFRLTVPLLAKVFRLNLIWVVIVEIAIGILSIYLILLYFFSLTKQPQTSFWFCLAFCFTPLLKFAFFDELFFDSFAYFFLLLLLVFRNPYWGVLLTLLACYTDERGYLGASFLLLYFLIDQKLNARNNVKIITSVASGLLFSMVIRYLLGKFYGLSVPMGDNNLVGLSVLNEHFCAMPYYFYTCFESLWVAIPLGAYYLARNKMTVFAILLLTTSTVFLISISMVHDITRSGLYGFPLILLGMMVFIHYSDTNFVSRIAKYFALLCFVQPSTLVIIGYVGSRWMFFLHYSKYIDFVKSIFQ
jgi:hypothetical protein